MEKKITYSIKTNVQGVCPVCDSKNLEYDKFNFYDDELIMPWICNDCGTNGMETYSLNFKAHYDIYNENHDGIDFDDNYVDDNPESWKFG